MDITITVPDQIFLTSKTPEQIVRELCQAAAIFWRVRGDIATEAADEIKASTHKGAEEDTSAAGLKEFLLSMPNEGDDADFERPVDYGRPEVEWDT